jgi:hypothetical protein
MCVCVCVCVYFLPFSWSKFSVQLVCAFCSSSRDSSARQLDVFCVSWNTSFSFFSWSTFARQTIFLLGVEVLFSAQKRFLCVKWLSTLSVYTSVVCHAFLRACVFGHQFVSSFSLKVYFFYILTSAYTFFFVEVVIYFYVEIPSSHFVYEVLSNSCCVQNSVYSHFFLCWCLIVRTSV